MKKHSVKSFLKSLLALVLCLCMSGSALADVLTLPKSIKVIEEEAFYGDKSIDEVVLPEGVEEIGPRAFGDSSLTKVNLPDSLTYIAEDAFDIDADINYSANPEAYAGQWLYENGLDEEQKNHSSFLFIGDEQSFLPYDPNSVNYVIDHSTGVIPPESGFGGMVGYMWPALKIGSQDVLWRVKVQEGNEWIHLKMKKGRGTTLLNNIFFCDDPETNELRQGKIVFTAGVMECILYIHQGSNGPVTGITLDTNEKDLVVGEAFTLHATLQPEFPENPVVTWSSSDESVATVDEDGSVTAVSGGQAIITVTTSNNLTAVCQINVIETILVEQIILEGPETIVYEPGQEGTDTVYVHVLPENADDITYSWTSSDSDEKIASISPDGTVRVWGSGEVTFTATANDGSGVSAEITIEAVRADTPSDEFEFYNLTTGNTVLANTVDIYSVELGDLTIGATTNSIRLAEYARKNIVKIFLSDEEPDFADPTQIDRRTGDLLVDEVITVEQWRNMQENQTGFVISQQDLTRAKYLQIMVGLYQNEKAEEIQRWSRFALKLEEDAIEPENISIDRDYVEMYLGDICTLTVLVLPENASDRTVTWHSDDNNIATVNEQGVVTAVSIGTTTITAETTNHLIAYCMVSVIHRPPDTSIEGFTFEENEDGSSTLVAYTGADTDVIIPAADGLGRTVKYIGKAFSGTLINSVYIPDTVEGLASDAFSNCTNLTEIRLSEGLKYIPYDNEWGNVFGGCTSLTQIEIPASVLYIGGYTFSGCTSLTSVILHEGLTGIGGSAFAGCGNLTDITLPRTMKSIGDWTFSGSGITSITIPDTVTSIGNGAFKYCENLGSITIPNSVVSIGNGAFQDCPVLARVELSESLTSIDDYAFNGCSALKGLVIPNTVKSIGNSAFGGCSALASITLPSQLTIIHENLFYECVNLRAVSIPHSVAVIGSCAFYACTNLTTLYIPASVISIAGNAFGDCYDLIIYGEAGSAAEDAANEYDYVDFVPNGSGEEKSISGSFLNGTMTIPLDDTLQTPAAIIRSTGAPIHRITLTLNDWNQDGTNNNRYRTHTFEGQDLHEISLTDPEWASEYVLDTTRPPFNEPGEYIINLWADTGEGNGVKLDSMSVNIIGTYSLSGTVLINPEAAAINAGVYAFDLNNRYIGSTRTNTQGHWSLNVEHEGQFLISFYLDGYVFEKHYINTNETDDVAIGTIDTNVLSEAEITLSQNGLAINNEPVRVGSSVDFYVNVPNEVTQIRLFIDGKTYDEDTHAVTNGICSFSRVFNKAGNRIITISGEIDGVWTNQMLVCALQVTAQEALDNPKIKSITDPIYIENTLSITWYAVNHANGYNIYLYLPNGDVVTGNVPYTGADTYTYSFETSDLSKGIYQIGIYAYGLGYSQSGTSEMIKIREPFYYTDPAWPQGEEITTYLEPNLKSKYGYVDNTEQVTILDEEGDFFYIRMHRSAGDYVNRYVLKKDIDSERYISTKGFIDADYSIVDEKILLTIHADKYAVEAGVLLNDSPVTNPMNNPTRISKDGKEKYFEFPIDPVEGLITYTVYVKNYDDYIDKRSLDVIYETEQTLLLPNIKWSNYRFFGPNLYGRNETVMAKYLSSSGSREAIPCEITGAFEYPSDQQMGVCVYQVNTDNTYSYICENMFSYNPTIACHEGSIHLDLNIQGTVYKEYRDKENKFKRDEYRFVLFPTCFLNGISPNCVHNNNIQLLLENSSAYLLVIDVFPTLEGEYTIGDNIQCFNFSNMSSTHNVFLDHAPAACIILNDFEYYWLMTDGNTGYCFLADDFYNIVQDSFATSGFSMKTVDKLFDIKLKIERKIATSTGTLYVVARWNASTSGAIQYQYSPLIPFATTAEEKVDEELSLSTDFQLTEGKEYDFAIIEAENQKENANYIFTYFYQKESDETKKNRFISMLKYAYEQRFNPFTAKRSDFNKNNFLWRLRNRLGPDGFGLENKIIDTILTYLESAPELERMLYLLSIWDYDVVLYTDDECCWFKEDCYNELLIYQDGIRINDANYQSGSYSNFMIVWFHESGHALDYNGLEKNKYSSPDKIYKYLLQDFHNLVYRFANDQEITMWTGDVLAGENAIYTKQQTDIIAEYLLDYDRGGSTQSMSEFTELLSDAQISAGCSWTNALTHVCSGMKTEINKSKMLSVPGDPNAFAAEDVLAGLTNNYEAIGFSHTSEKDYWRNRKYGPVMEFAAEYYSSKVTQTGAARKTRYENERFFGNATTQMNLMEIDMLENYLYTRYKPIEPNGGAD